MSAESLADLSNVLIYSSMLVLTIAMVFFAVSFAGRRVAGQTRSTHEVPVPAAVGAGAFEGPGDEVSFTISADPVEGEQSEPGRRPGNIGLALSWLALLLLIGADVARALWAGRAPWGNMYEFSITSATAVLAVFLVVSLRRDVRWLGVFVIPAVLLSLGLAVTVLYTEAAQLVPALDSYWLVIHVSMAILCGGAFAVAGVLSGLFLIRDRAEQRGTLGGFTGRLPQAERLDTLAYRMIAFTMPVWTFAIVSGAIWAENAWGRYWGWDPKETWAFITWMVYAGYLHARATAGWRGRRAAILCLLGLLTFVFNYFGVNLFFSGLHSYAGV